jgi:hypothetical protein
VVADIAKLSLGREDYYVSEVAEKREEYLSGHGESPSRWLGRGAQALGQHGVATTTAHAARPKPKPKPKAMPKPKPRPVVDPRHSYNSIALSRSVPLEATAREQSLLNASSLSTDVGGGILIPPPPILCAPIGPISPTVIRTAPPARTGEI